MLYTLFYLIARSYDARGIDIITSIVVQMKD